MNAQTQNMPAQSPAKAFQVYMQKYKSQLEMALPKHLTVDRMMRLSLTAFSQNPKLQQCSSNSIFSSIIIASQLGLEPGVNGQGYLVPYNGTCTFIPGWKGLVDLAQRGGRSSVWTGAVYEGDEFDYMLGDSPYCRHKPCGEFDNDKLTHVYAIGRVKDSEMPIIEVWPVKKVHAHFVKTVVKGLQPNHYSKKHFEAYARKVALLQVLKYMPQSIELSNAMDVSHAQESGKGVTIDGDFVNVEQDQQEQNSQNSTQNDAYQPQEETIQEPVDAEQEEIEYAPTFAQIKKGILTAKSPAHLDVMEEQAMDHADKDERKQLMTLIKAQSAKFQPAKEVTPVKKPEVVQEPEPPIENVEVVEITGKTSDEVLQEYNQRLNDCKAVAEINETHEIFVSDQRLTTGHIEELKKLSVALKAKLKPKPVAIDPIKSDMAKGGLLLIIQKAKDLDELSTMVKSITETKPRLLPEHHQEVLQAYAQRKEILSQADIFEDEPMSYMDSAIKKIRNARSQDEINDVYADPAFDELSGADRETVDKEAQQRESELQD